MITSEGVQIADQATPADSRAAQDAVNSALKQAGLTITMLPPAPSAASATGTAATADSGGIAIHAVLPGLPPGNEVRLMFGRSTAEVSASQVAGAGGAGAAGPLGSTDSGTVAPGALPSTVDAAFAPGAGVAEGAVPVTGLPDSAVPGVAGLPIPGAAALPAVEAGNSSLLRRAVPASYLVGSECGFACTYGVFGAVLFALPVAYITRRYLMGA